MNVDLDLLEDINDSASSAHEAELSSVLLFQTEKLELVSKRDALAQKKVELESAIDIFNITLAHYKKQQSQYETKRRLEYFLHQSDREFEKLNASDEAATFVLENLDVLPSKDIKAREVLIHKFYPAVTISNASSGTEFLEGNPFSTIEYFMASKYLPSIHVKLLSRHETVHLLRVCNLSNVATGLERICPRYYRALNEDYIPRGAVDLLMYSYHALAQLQSTRTAALRLILDKYSSSVTRPTSAATPLDSVLQCLPYIEIKAPTEKEMFIRLYWSIELSSPQLAEFESHLSYVLGTHDQWHSADDIFSKLVSRHGVLNAFNLMYNNLFEV